MDKRWRRCNLLSPMLPTYSCIRTFPCKIPWCLLKLQRNFPREYHAIFPVHLRIKIWSNGECALFVANTFCPLKWKLFTGLVAESLKYRVILKTQQSMCNHCELLPVGKGSCYMWYVMAFWEMGWALIDEGDVEDFDLLNITGDENESEFGTPFFDIDKVIPIWSDETEDCLYWHCHIS